MKKSKEEKKDKQEAMNKLDKKAARIVEELEQKIDELSSEKQELLDKYQRLQADYANHVKRTPKQIADSVAYEKRVILLSLLPSLDNFAHALTSARSAKENQSAEGIVKGVELILQHLLDALKVHGVQQVESLGKPFDPSVHEAVMQRYEEGKPDGIVLEEFQAGYLLNGQTLRPAKVIVNKVPVETPEIPTPETTSAQQTNSEQEEEQTNDGE
ncbi:MAG: nucleotide exchange factor GrpE [Sedimentisphaerales bacterium]|nr:nucleotide exchange factor GrpE [Sedimentisphaerales bacterium]